jgi:hypothetical protein
LLENFLFALQEKTSKSLEPTMQHALETSMLEMHLSHAVTQHHANTKTLLLEMSKLTPELAPAQRDQVETNTAQLELDHLITRITSPN